MGVLPNLGGLYEPPDVDEAHEAWGASCGPAALGAVLRRPVGELHDALGRPTKSKTWVTPTDMRSALARLEVPYSLTGTALTQVTATSGAQKESYLPTYGLALLQLAGPWTAPNRPAVAAYRHTHWVGVSRAKGDDETAALFYDINAGQAPGPSGGWLPLDAWLAFVLPLLVKGSPGATGEWWCRTGIEVIRMSGRSATPHERAVSARALAKSRSSA